MADLIPVSKGADYLEVHPDTLAEHQRLGWAQCAKREAEDAEVEQHARRGRKPKDAEAE